MTQKDKAKAEPSTPPPPRVLDEDALLELVRTISRLTLALESQLQTQSPGAGSSQDIGASESTLVQDDNIVIVDDSHSDNESMPELIEPCMAAPVEHVSPPAQGPAAAAAGALPDPPTPDEVSQSFLGANISETSRFYVVIVGRNPGVYSQWDEAQPGVIGVSGAVFYSRTTLTAALDAYRQAYEGRRVRRV